MLTISIDALSVRGIGNITTLAHRDAVRRVRPLHRSTAVPPLFEFGNVALDPTHYRRMRQINSALGHHLDEISKTQLEPQIPAHAEDDHLPSK